MNHARRNIPRSPQESHVYTFVFPLPSPRDAARCLARPLGVAATVGGRGGGGRLGGGPLVEACVCVCVPLSVCAMPSVYVYVLYMYECARVYV